MKTELELEFGVPVVSDIGFTDMKHYKFDYGILSNGSIMRLIDYRHDLITTSSMNESQINLILSEYERKENYCKLHKIKYEIR